MDGSQAPALFKWLNAGQASEVGSALADELMLQVGERGDARRRTPPPSRVWEKNLQRFFQRVDRDTRALRLNAFRTAVLANSFKWRLLEQGIAREVVGELTQTLVVRLSAGQGSPAAAAVNVTGNGSSPTKARADAAALLAEADASMARGAHAEAAAAYQRLLDLDPRHAVARNNLGAALSKLGRYGEAEDQFRRAIALRSTYADAQANLGTVLRWTGRIAESETALRRALKLKPASICAQASLGSSLISLGRLREARAELEKALKAAPRNPEVLTGLGQIAALEGDFAEADTRFRRAVELDPNLPGPWAALAQLRRMTVADGVWFKGAQSCAESGLAPHDEANIRYAIGKYYDDVGDFRRAFRSYQSANELQKKIAQPYDRESRTRFVDDLICAYTPQTLTSARSAASDSERPVFVVGMPRSGTTLVAQIIDSHAEAKSAGELAFWPDAAHKHAAALRQRPPEGSLSRKLAASYLDVLARRFPKPRRVVDKTPFNLDHLGLIHSIFPRARILWVRRDPIDACLSCYFQPFPPTLNFTLDLSDLVHYHREHARLAAHWQRVLPPQTLLEVPYAALVGAQEEWSRRIIEFLGLGWDETCLTFYKAERPVLTASYWQVRQKIYATSLRRWRHYQKFIGPLLELRDA